MDITIGQMRSEVIFYLNAPTPLGAGKKDVYSPDLVTRGRLRKNSGSRALSVGLIEGQDSYTLLCRFQSDLASMLRINGKVTVDGIYYTISTFEKIDQINHLYKFTLNTAVLA